MLKKLDEQSLDTARQLRNENREFFFDQSEISTAQQQYWFENYYHPEAGKEEMFVIIVEEQIVGTIFYRYHDKDTVELGRMLLDEPHRGKGLIQCAIQQLLSELKFIVAYLEVYQDNKRAIRAYEKAGFVIDSEDGDISEGILKPFYKMIYKPDFNEI